MFLLNGAVAGGWTDGWERQRRREERISNHHCFGGRRPFRVVGRAYVEYICTYMSQSTMYPALGGQGQGQGNRCGRRKHEKESQGQNNDNKTPTGGAGAVEFGRHFTYRQHPPPMEDTGLLFSSLLSTSVLGSGPEACVSGFGPGDRALPERRFRCHEPGCGQTLTGRLGKHRGGAAKWDGRCAADDAA